MKNIIKGIKEMMFAPCQRELQEREWRDIMDLEMELMELKWKWFDDCSRLIGTKFNHQGFDMCITGIKEEIIGQSSTLFSHKTIKASYLIAEYTDQHGKIHEYKVCENRDLFARLLKEHNSAEKTFNDQ